MSGTAPLNNLEQIVAKISELETALKENTPNYESLLHQIHVNLHKDESLTHLITEDQIGVVVRALSKKKSIVIATTAAKSKGGGNAGLKNLTLDDL